MKPHPVANREIVVHMPPAVLFHDGFFLARIGVNDRGIFRIGSVVIILAAPMLAFLFAILIDDHTLPHWLLGSSQRQQIKDQHDKSNANTDSALVATKRSLIFNELNKELYRKFFMNRNELQACKDGYIYIHDQSARLDTMNSCLFDVGNVLKGGFEMGNVWYNEPKTLDTAFDVMGDIVLSTAAQQYGGFTVPEVDKILAPYAQ